MDYKKLAADLLSGCDGNCANCNYARREFECDLSRLAANAITELSGKIGELEKQLAEAKLKRPIELSGQGAENFTLAIQLSEMKQQLSEVTAERDSFMKDWEVMSEIAGAVREAGAERAAELVEADRDGRCVVLPCKVGDTVYVVGTCKEIESFFDDGYLWPEESSCPFEDSCDAEECEENHIRIFETLATDFWIGEQNENHLEVFLESLSEGKMVSDFGKTIFRDKEAAEAALERMKSNGCIHR